MQSSRTILKCFNRKTARSRWSAIACHGCIDRCQTSAELFQTHDDLAIAISVEFEAWSRLHGSRGFTAIGSTEQPIVGMHGDVHQCWSCLCGSLSGSPLVHSWCPETTKAKQSRVGAGICHIRSSYHLIYQPRHSAMHQTRFIQCTPKIPKVRFVHAPTQCKTTLLHIISAPCRDQPAANAAICVFHARRVSA